MNEQEAFALIDARADFVLAYTEYERGIQRARYRLHEAGYGGKKIDELLKEWNETMQKVMSMFG